jgi:hypothetical protein
MTKSNIAKLVDDFGQLKAQIATLEQQEAEIRLQLVASGHDAVEGELFRVTVVKTIKETLSTAAAKAKLIDLGVDQRWFTKHTTHTPTTTVRCVARTGEGDE